MVDRKFYVLGHTDWSFNLLQSTISHIHAINTSMVVRSRLDSTGFKFCILEFEKNQNLH